MPEHPSLWSLRVFGTTAQLSLVEGLFIEEALSFTLLEARGPQQSHAEAIFDLEPVPSAVKASLAQIDASLTFEISPVDDVDWVTMGGQELTPFPVARWTIHGSEFRDRMHATELTIQLDETSAFGTGKHPTTCGCLIMLDRLLTKHHRSAHWRMLDMGCGSGVLAMAFTKATHGYALGIDMDEDAVRIARENLRRNNLELHTRVETGTGYSNPLVAQNAPYDLIMANVFATPLCEMAADLARHLRPGGYAILSGILNSQEKRVVSAHRQQGLRHLHRMRIGEWSVLALRRPLRQS